jgi:hypothetical protein
MRQQTAEALRQGAVAGLRKGLSGFLWMLRILVPVSLGTAVLGWSGLLEKLGALLAPVMGLLHLPGTAALPLVIGGVGGIYGGLASMASLPLAPGEATLVAIFLLMAHNLVLEGIVQGKSGINGWVVTVFRILTAALTTWVCGLLIPAGAGAGDAPAAAVEAARAGFFSAPQAHFFQFLGGWALSTVKLSAKILLIITTLLVALEILKALGWLRHVVKALTPVLRVLGLGEETGYIWTAAGIFGLTYCAPLVVEEAKAGLLSRCELVKLNLSISINHSFIEDPLLFLSAGVGGVFWLFVPRLLVAILAVRLLSIGELLGRGRRERAPRGTPRP